MSGKAFGLSKAAVRASRHASLERFGVIFLAVVVSLMPFRLISGLEVVENWVTDFRISTLTPPEPQHDEIVVVSITEDTLQSFPYRSPVDRRFIANLLGSLEEKGAQGILLDILIDQPTEPAKDEELRAQLQNARIPVVVSYAYDPSGTILTAEQSAFLDDFVPFERRGMANLIRDPRDGTVRWVYPGGTIGDGRFINGAALELADQLGRAEPLEHSVPIVWRGSPSADTSAFRTFPADAVPILPEAWFRDKIVVVGFDLPLRDRHRTPLSLDFGSERVKGTPGAIVHAHILAQILDDRTFPALENWQRIALTAGLTIFGFLLAGLRFNLWFGLLLWVASAFLYWTGALAVYRYMGVLLPLLEPTLGAVIGYGLGLLYTGSDARRQKRAAQKDARRKADLLANMSHELRTPINAVIGMTELVLETTTDREHERYLNVVVSSARSLLELINDILDYSKLSSGKLVMEEIPFDLRREIEEAVALLGISARGKGLSLDVQIDSTLPDCFTGDPARLRQVLFNVIGNAIKFTETGGITLSVSRPSEESASDDMVGFEVRDTGIGIAPDRLKAIFGRYAQADRTVSRQHGGTGLGMSISKQIVERMDGRIWVESELGVGSVFSFVIRLPEAEGAVDYRVGETQSDAPAVRRLFDILLADDVEQNIELASIRLRKAGHTVTVARDGQEALDAYRKSRFDLILMDVEMPHMSGLEATRAIRQLEKLKGDESRVPIIALTAGDGDRDKDRCLESGMDAFAVKPIDFRKLCDLMERVIPEGIGRAAPEEDDLPGVPSAEVDSELPAVFRRLVGIDVTAGLIRWGDAEVYQKSLAGFARNYAKEGETLSQAIADGDLDKAKRVVHTMKGVSGTLEATELNAAATELDAALRTRKGDKPDMAAIMASLNRRNVDLNVLVTRFTDALDQVIGSCAGLGEDPKPSTDKTEPQKTRRLDEKGQSLVLELARNLNQGNPLTSEETIKELAVAKCLRQNDLVHLEQLIDEVRLEEALAFLKEISVFLGVDIEDEATSTARMAM